MASACVNDIGMSPDKFSPVAAYSSYRWISPRVVSLSREHERASSASKDTEKEKSQAADPPEEQDPAEFEFRLEDPVAMLSADELFSDGKLLPLKFSDTGKLTTTVNMTTETAKSCRKLEMEISGMDSYIFSPKAPRCTTRWRELLGLKRLAKNQQIQEQSSFLKTTTSSSSSSSSSSANPKTSSLKHLLHRSSKLATSSPSSSSDAASTLNLPLLKDSDFSDSLSISSSRRSLSSSSSSSHELDDLPRLSLDLDKPGPNPFAPARSHGINPNQPRTARLAKPRPSATDGRSSMRRRNQAAEEPPFVAVEGMVVTADSPRLNASGKIVFHGLERSSSSPSSFNGGPRMKHQGMPRSYSANVRIPPVLNVPVCSLRGSSKSGLFFGQIFSSPSSSSSPSQQKNGGARGPSSHSHGKNRSDRT